MFCRTRQPEFISVINIFFFKWTDSPHEDKVRFLKRVRTRGLILVFIKWFESWIVVQYATYTSVEITLRKDYYSKQSFLENKKMDH